jgi:phytoene synthase
MPFWRDQAFLNLMEFEAQRAREYYRESAPLVEMIDAKSRASLRALIGIYSRLLARIVDSDYDVLARRIRVPTWQKLWLLVSARFSG